MKLIFPKQVIARLFLLAVVTLLASGRESAQAADVRGYGVFKTQDFVQTSTNAPVLQTNWPAYSFSAIVQPTGLFSNQVVSASIESPLGFVDQLFPPVAGTDQPFASYFAATSQSELDANFPLGNYLLRINTAHDGNRVITLPMTNASATAFPANAPRIANFTEAQTIDVSTNFVLRWDAFAGGTTNDVISVSIADTNGVVVYRTATFGAEPGFTSLNGTNLSVVIASNTLTWGQSYRGYIYFEKDPVIQTTNYPGARGLVGFAKATSFPLRTPPREPTLAPLGIVNNRFALKLSGISGRRYAIHAKTTLTGNWTPVFTNVALEGGFYFTNTSVLNPPVQFYRAQLLP